MAGVKASKTANSKKQAVGIKKLKNREESWLSFNERVLQEAGNKQLNIFERLFFLSIFSSNRDEFFRVRVASIRRSIRRSSPNTDKLEKSVRLKKIIDIVKKQQIIFEQQKKLVINDLAKENVHFTTDKISDAAHKQFLQQFYFNHVKKYVAPVLLSDTVPFPYLTDNMLYLAVEATNKTRVVLQAIIEVPTDKLSRFIVYKDGKSTKITILEDLIRMYLNDLFFGFNYNSINAYAIKINRDSELELENNLYYSDLEKIENSLIQRKIGLPQRMVYDNSISKSLLNHILKKVDVISRDHIIPESKYLNFKDFGKLLDILNAPKSRILEPVYHNALKKDASYFDVINKRDIMLHFPYHSFNHVIYFLIQAATDPKVTSIRLTLYRVAKNSAIVHALIQALRAGKRVEVEIELKARFDEENNIEVAKKLQNEGANVRFGFNELKCHAKLILVERKVKNSLQQFLYFGTGNLNENTAKLYSDIGIFTSKQELTKEISKLFDYLNNHYKIGTFRHHWISPFSFRKKLANSIKNEIAEHQKDGSGRIWIKLNNLVDADVCKMLMKAVVAGVSVKIIVRSSCALYMMPEYPNLEIISIIDQYLEHARVFIFGKGKRKKTYISSADLMERNLDARIEVGSPVLDKTIANQIEDILQIQLNDNQSARYIDEAMTNTYKTNTSAQKINAQKEIYNYIRSLK